VALPLLFARFNAAIEMRSLSTASERLVTNGVAATQYTQAIVRQVASLERTARLFQILRRPALLETFRQNHKLLVQTLDGLEDLPGDPDRAAVIERIRSRRIRSSVDLAVPTRRRQRGTAPVHAALEGRRPALDARQPADDASSRNCAPRLTHAARILGADCGRSCQ